MSKPKPKHPNVGSSLAAFQRKDKASPTMTSLRALVGASGRSPRDLERGCGVSYRTILRWLKEDPEFITHLEAVLGALGYELIVRKGLTAKQRALKEKMEWKNWDLMLHRPPSERDDDH